MIIKTFDKRIQETVRSLIRLHSMKEESWEYTRLDNFHNEVLSKINFNENELPIITSYISDSSWYMFTTQRIIGTLKGDIKIVPLSEFSHIFPNNFKGRDNKNTELMEICLLNKSSIFLEFETGYASMAPIYYRVAKSLDDLEKIEKWVGLRQKRKQRLQANKLTFF